MDVQGTSTIVYGAIVAVWFVFELLGLARRRGLPIPWYTNSETIWAIERHYPKARILVLAIGLDVVVHLAFGTPLTPHTLGAVSPDPVRDYRPHP